MQSVMMAAAALGNGTSHIRENVFEKGFGGKRIAETRNGDIIIEDKFAQVSGVEALKGTSVMAEDLRGGAAPGGLSCRQRNQSRTAVMNISAGYEGYLRGSGREQEPASKDLYKAENSFSDDRRKETDGIWIRQEKNGDPSGSGHCLAAVVIAGVCSIRIREITVTGNENIQTNRWQIWCFQDNTRTEQHGALLPARSFRKA